MRYLPVVNLSFSSLTGLSNDTLDRRVYSGCCLNRGMGQKRLEQDKSGRDENRPQSRHTESKSKTATRTLYN